MKAKILSIDAWRYGDGWCWNDLWKVGTVDAATLDKLTTPRRVLAYLRSEGYLTAASAGKVQVDMGGDIDGVCIEIQDRRGRPLFAISTIHGE